jgi:hypothetical protein
MASLAAGDPALYSTWTGKLTLVTVRTGDGRELQAVALAVVSGPTTKPLLGGSTVAIEAPILSEIDDGIVRVQDPATLPVGKTVRIKGAVNLFTLNVSRREATEGDYSVSRTFSAGGTPQAEVFLIAHNITILGP